MSRVKRNKRVDETFVKAVQFNKQVMQEGPTKKKWTPHDLKTIQPITDAQSQMFEQYLQGDNVVAYGCPGTGKTLLALYLAMCDILDQRTPYQRLIIVRSAVASRDQGYLKGTLEEKESVFETPYKDIFAFLFGRASTYEDMKKAGLIEFMSTSYVRGLTWDNCIVVVDEIQNCNWHEINSVVTRVGDDSKMVLAGDIKQTDLLKSNKDVCGMGHLLEVVERMDEMSSVQFTSDDIVRSAFVKAWIIATESL
jgi:phosphate starvation-inducible protein PhoH